MEALAAIGDLQNDKASVASNSSNDSVSPLSNKPLSKMTREEKLQRRLARKAELARASRKRKKAYVESLETRVQNLESQLSIIQKHVDLSTIPGVSMTTLANTVEDLMDMPGLSGNKFSLEGLGGSGVSPSASAHQRSVKATFNGECRRFVVHDSNRTYSMFLDLVRGIFENLPPSFSIKYVDDEEDEIAITSDFELLEAFRLAPVGSVLKIKIVSSPSNPVSPNAFSAAAAVAMAQAQAATNGLSQTGMPFHTFLPQSTFAGMMAASQANFISQLSQDRSAQIVGVPSAQTSMATSGSSLEPVLPSGGPQKRKSPDSSSISAVASLLDISNKYVKTAAV